MSRSRVREGVPTNKLAMAQGVIETARGGIRIRVARERCQHVWNDNCRLAGCVKPCVIHLHPVVTLVTDRGICLIGSRVGRSGEIVRVVPGAGVRRHSNIPRHFVARSTQAGSPLRNRGSLEISTMTVLAGEKTVKCATGRQLGVLAVGNFPCGDVMNRIGMTGETALQSLTMALCAGLRISPVLRAMGQRFRPASRVGHESMTKGVVETTG